MDEDLFHSAIEKTTMGIFVIKHIAEIEPRVVGIVLEGVIVLQDLENVAFATAMLFGLIYSLNLKYPTTLRYTFEILQKSSWSWMGVSSLSRPKTSNPNFTCEMYCFFAGCMN